MGKSDEDVGHAIEKFQMPSDGEEMQNPHVLKFGELATDLQPDRAEEANLPEAADDRLFTQSVRDKDKLSEYRASKGKLRQLRRASAQAALEANAQKDAELQEIKKKGLDGSADHIIAQIKKERTEISMQVSDHKAERLKRISSSVLGKKSKDASDDFFSIGMSVSKLPDLQKACWEVTNFVPLKLPTEQIVSATSSSTRELTEDKSVLNALHKLFELLEGFSNQNEQFLKMLCEDPDVAVISVPAGVRAATKGQPMTRSLVLLSGQAHNLSYAGVSHILLEESHSTRMNTGDCLGFIHDDEDCTQENAFTIICQTGCSFLEIPKSSVDAIFAHMKMERFLSIMNVNPEDRIESDVQFLLNFAKKNAFFKQLKESRQLNLCRQARMETFKQEDVLFHEDDRGHTYYIIIRGSVRVSKNVGGAKDTLGNKIFSHVAILGQGVGFGELALLSSSGVRQATVTAHEDSVFMTLSRRTYNEVLRGEHEHSLQETIRAVVHVFPYVLQRDKIFQTYIAQLFREEELPTGYVLAEQGAKANTFYILKEGVLAVDTRVEYSRYSTPTDAGLSYTESTFETKTLKKFSQKENKTRIIPFGELSHFGDTIGDVDMLADPIWAAKYLYRATVLKPAIVCSISWSALKIRFPHEMLDELRVRSHQKFILFKSIFDSAVATEYSNSQFSCISAFCPLGYNSNILADDKAITCIKSSLGDLLDKKKMILRRKIRNRMDVPVSEAFKATVHEWISEMSPGNVFQNIELENESIKRKTEAKLASSDSLSWSNDLIQDSALQAMMRSAFMDKNNVDECVDNIIKMTRADRSSDDDSGTQSDVQSSKLTRKGLHSIKDFSSPALDDRIPKTPIPGYKPHFVRYDLTEEHCKSVEGLIEDLDDITLLDSSVVQTRPSSRAMMGSSRSKSRFGSKSRQGTAGSHCNHFDADQVREFSHEKTASDYLDLSPERCCNSDINPEDEHELPSYFYPDHYRIQVPSRNSRNLNRDSRRMGKRGQAMFQSAMVTEFDGVVVAKPIQSRPVAIDSVNHSSPQIFRRNRIATPPYKLNPPLPKTDKCILNVKSLQNHHIPFTVRSAALQIPPNKSAMKDRPSHKMRLSASRAIYEHSSESKEKQELQDSMAIDYIIGLSASECLLESDIERSNGIETIKSQKHPDTMGSFTQEKESNWENQLESDSDGMLDYLNFPGNVCSPDPLTVAETKAESLETSLEPKTPSKDEKFRQILKSGFSINSRMSEDADKLQSQTKDVERLIKERARAETKMKISHLLSSGILDNKINHLRADELQNVDFELSDGLLQKMHDVTIRRMNDPNFKGQRLKVPLQLQFTEKSSAKNVKRLSPAATPKTFDFSGFDQSLLNKSKTFDETTCSSYHNEQMLKMQNRHAGHQKIERRQLLKNLLSKSNNGPAISGQNVDILNSLPSIALTSPLQPRKPFT